MPSAFHNATIGSSLIETLTRDTLVAGTYKPDETTTGLLPGWDTTNLTKIDASSPNVSSSFNSGINWPTLLPPDGTVYENVWFHIPVWIVAGRKVTFRNCLFDGHGIPNLIDTTASNYETPPNPSAVDFALLDLSAVGVSGAPGNVKTNVIIEDCEFNPDLPGDSVNGIRGCGFSLYRSKITNCVDGIDLFRNGTNEQLGVYIEASYITELAYFNTIGNHSNNATHNDCLQWAGGAGWEMFGTSIEAIGRPNNAPGGSEPAPYYPAVGNAMSVTSNAGPATGMNVHDSWFDGGYHGFIAIVTSNAATHTNLGSFTNNVFGTQIVSSATIQISQYMSLTNTNSTYASNGAAVPISIGES